MLHFGIMWGKPHVVRKIDAAEEYAKRLIPVLPTNRMTESGGIIVTRQGEVGSPKLRLVSEMTEKNRDNRKLVQHQKL